MDIVVNAFGGEHKATFLSPMGWFVIFEIVICNLFVYCIL